MKKFMVEKSRTYRCLVHVEVFHIFNLVDNKPRFRQGHQLVVFFRQPKPLGVDGSLLLDPPP